MILRWIGMLVVVPVLGADSEPATRHLLPGCEAEGMVRVAGGEGCGRRLYFVPYERTLLTRAAGAAAGVGREAADAV